MIVCFSNGICLHFHEPHHHIPNKMTYFSMPVSRNLGNKCQFQTHKCKKVHHILCFIHVCIDVLFWVFCYWTICANPHYFTQKFLASSNHFHSNKNTLCLFINIGIILCFCCLDKFIQIYINFALILQVFLSNLFTLCLFRIISVSMRFGDYDSLP